MAAMPERLGSAPTRPDFRAAGVRPDRYGMDAIMVSLPNQGLRFAPPEHDE